MELTRCGDTLVGSTAGRGAFGECSACHVVMVTSAVRVASVCCTFTVEQGFSGKPVYTYEHAHGTPVGPAVKSFVAAGTGQSTAPKDMCTSRACGRTVLTTP